MQIIADELLSLVAEKRLKSKSNDLLNGVRLIDYANSDLSPQYLYVGYDTDFNNKHVQNRNLSAVICIGTKTLSEMNFFEGIELIRIESIKISQIFEMIQSIFEKYNQWDDELSSAIMAHLSIKDIADIGQKVLTNPIAIFDSSIYCLATSGELPSNHIDPLWNTLLKTEYAINFNVQSHLRQVYGENLGKKEEVILIKKFDCGSNKPFDIMMSYIFKDGVRLGNIGMTEIWAPITYGQAFLCEHFSKRLKHWFVYTDCITVSEKPIKQLITNLLNGKHVTEAAIKSCVDWMDKKRTTDCYLISFKLKTQESQLNDGIENFLRYVEKALSESKKTNEIVLQYKESVLMIIQEPFIDGSILSYIDGIRSSLQESISKTHIGISDPFNVFEDIRNAYFQSIAAIDIGGKLDPNQEHYLYSKYAIDHLINIYLKESSPDIFCHHDILRLHNFDCANGTEYVKTLEAYYSCLGSLSQAAELLHIHRNSLAYRMEKIKELLNVEELKHKDSLHILLSCRMLERRIN